MRRDRFQALAPICPVCAAGERASALELVASLREESGHLVAGIIRRADPGCLSEYPVLDGIPYLLARLREVVARDVTEILARDLPEQVGSLIGDCCGPGSPAGTGTSTCCRMAATSSRPRSHWRVVNERPIRPGSAARTSAARQD